MEAVSSTKLFGNSIWGKIWVTLPTTVDFPDDEGFPLNIGALELSLDGRNFVLDTVATDYDLPEKAGDYIEIESRLAVDLDFFEIGEEYNYQLTTEDLLDQNLKASFYLSDDDFSIKDAWDWDNIKIVAELYVGKTEEAYYLNNIELDR